MRPLTRSSKTPQAGSALHTLTCLWTARPKVSGLVLIVLTSIWLLAAFNLSFWARSFEQLKSHPGLFGLFVLAIWALTVVYLLVFANRWLLRPFLIANILIAAGASYFHERMGIIIDREMIQNILGTTGNESGALLTASCIRYMLIFAVLPSLVIALIRVTHPPFRRSVLRHAALLIGCGVFFAGVTYGNYQFYSFALKQSPGLRKILHPIGPIRSGLQYVEMIWAAETAEFQTIALDAHKGAISEADNRPILTLLVIGETLRDQNWGLSGYARDTTPDLRKRDVLSIAGVETCGTSTSVSLPCMFSNLDRRNFSYEAALASENLLDVLVRAGFDVEWWDTNTGDMGVAARVPYSNFNRADDAEFCEGGECNDGILFKRLEERAGAITHDTVIVMHQIGNHGPAYFQRYPQGFARFLPDCRDADLVNCPVKEVVNAYDNAIAYTDFQLARIIDYLGSRPDLDTSLIYVSDHGESLGENGLYLHAAPFWIAPKEQTRVPMLIWMSAGFQKAMKLDYACVAPAAGMPASHDYFFHSVLGMLDVETAEHQRQLDLFAGCRSLGV